jgi:hypothetical protein
MQAQPSPCSAGLVSRFFLHAYKLGIIELPVPYSKLTVERLHKAIMLTLASARYRKMAPSLAEKIRAERGVEQACLLIEEFVEESCTRRQSFGV